MARFDPVHMLALDLARLLLDLSRHSAQLPVKTAGILATPLIDMCTTSWVLPPFDDHTSGSGDHALPQQVKVGAPVALAFE